MYFKGSSNSFQIEFFRLKIVTNNHRSIWCIIVFYPNTELGINKKVCYLYVFIKKVTSQEVFMTTETS